VIRQFLKDGAALAALILIVAGALAWADALTRLTN